ncbi:MAG: TlpA family protein disulfide reductase [Gammaproteobacteria bacterium]
MQPTIGEKAPNLRISEWAQGDAVNFDALGGRVVLVKVFQVNCPGCFLHAFPEAIGIHEKYNKQGLTVFGLATAFEDFDKNTYENLKLLADSGEVVGETRQALARQGLLKNNALSYSIPFPLAMDELTACAGEVSERDVAEFSQSQVPDYDAMPQAQRAQIAERVRAHLSAKKYRAETFERYALRGTPSSILVDAGGILRDVSFGQDYALEDKIRELLAA